MAPGSTSGLRCLAGMAIMLSCLAGGAAQEPAASPAAVRAAIAANTFGLRLYRELAEAPGNVVISPLSLQLALAMAYGGARGETAAQMAAAMHLPAGEQAHQDLAGLQDSLRALGSSGPCELALANALWKDRIEPWRPEFLELVRAHYGPGIRDTDFRRPEAARQEINAWAGEHTRGRIPDLIPPGIITPSTAMVLANALYFKGEWLTRFPTRGTRPAPFLQLDGHRVTVPMMSVEARFDYLDDPEVQLVRLPYAGGRLEMVVLLPPARPGIAEGFRQFEQSLSPQALAGWLARARPQAVTVSLPRFTLDPAAPLSLAAPLRRLGMEVPFRAGQADFSGMNGRHNLFISAVLQKTFVAVDEVGTEAAAATGVVISKVSLGPSFRADRPFVFLIRARATGALLFVGRLVAPGGRSL